MYFYNTVDSDMVHKCQQQGPENRINSFPPQKQSCKHLSSQRHKRIVTFLRSFDIAFHGGATCEWWEKSLLKVKVHLQVCSDTSLLFLSVFLKFHLKRMLDFLKFGLGITMGYLISVSACKPHSSRAESSCFFLCQHRRLK